MKLMEEIFFSFTFGGETLSLTAALATMTKIQKEPVVETLAKQGAKLLAGLDQLIKRFEVQDFISTCGHPSWSFFIIKDTTNYDTWQLKTLFLQEFFQRGIITLGTHNMSYAHTDGDIEKILKTYEEVLPIMATVVRNKELDKYLLCKPLVPLFKVR